MKRVVITGGTGFVGSNLARRLLEEGHTIHLLVRKTYKPWRIQDIKSSFYIHEVDFGDIQKLTQIISKIRPEWIFHLAAYGGYSWQNDIKQMLQINIIATINLVEACIKTGFEAFVNTGSSSEYGFKNHPSSEEERLEPNSYYAVTKASATLFCRYSTQRHKVYIPTLRLYSVYGPYEEPSRLIPTMIIKGMENKLPQLVSPEVSRDFVYVDDVVDAYLAAASTIKEDYGVIYNVGTGVKTSIREVVEVAKDVLGITVNSQWGSLPNRMWDTNVWVADIQKIQNELRWKPRYSLVQGFKETVEWLREHSDITAYYRKAIAESSIAGK